MVDDTGQRVKLVALPQRGGSGLLYVESAHSRRRIRAYATRRPPAPGGVTGPRGSGDSPGQQMASRPGGRWLRCRARPSEEEPEAQPHPQGRCPGSV